MRAYFFGNMYLSSIQQGIQALHCTAEMFIKYNGCTDIRELTLREWAGSHKTVILLNGGDDEGLRDIICFFGRHDNPYPWTYFHESQGALSKAMTCVGVILPEHVYDAAKVLREDGYLLNVDLTGWEFELCKVLNTCGMAR